MKVVFLDIDGVLNTLYTSRIEHPSDIENRLFQNLVKILVETDAKIVISSSWKYNNDNIKIIETILEEAEFLDRLIGYTTKDMYDCERVEEIKEWLNRNKVDKFAIIDDDEGAGIGMDQNFFLTHNKSGLTKEIAEAVTKHLR